MKNQGGCYVVKNGVKTQVKAPTKDNFREVYSEEEEAKDNALVEQVLDALRALEKRAEELKPGITNDPDNALPELAGRWKYDGFPKVGLAMLHRMMVKGGSDLLGAATAWEIHRDAIKKARSFYHAELSDQPLRLALWENGCSHTHGFPHSSSSAEAIENSFSNFYKLETTYFGEEALKPNDKNEVAKAAKDRKKKEKEEEKTKLANLFFNLYRTDPRYSKAGPGYEEAAEELQKQGIYVSGGTIKKAVEQSDNSIWGDFRAWGIPTSTIKAKKKGKK
ncbi:hypothetical protein HaloA020_14910 [Halomonas sp. A020]|uniref:hypothetical protein n=1 Tax=Halomonas sp. A020 TaxID=2717374 RepID=UPI002492C150|nr:hypothetical protein [Halomonas sp. A020]BCB60790.1 hypothetical protein HaloA020_14910 [Halomonas sp. A020]